jgi:hypothetical protein
MTYAAKNSTILLVFFLIIAVGGGFYVLYMQANQLKDIEQEREQIQRELGDVDELVNRREMARARVEVLDAAWAMRPKSMPSYEKASVTNMYLNEILTLSPELDLNVMTQEKVEQEGCGYTRYHLAGEGPFDSFSRLIQYLEFGPRVMKLANLDVREFHKVDEDIGVIAHLVQFDVDLYAYYTPQELFSDSAALVPLAETRIPLITYNPFRSLVTLEIPPNVNNLFEPENSTLYALTQDFAFVYDQSSRTVKLQEGDEVYLGYVSKIMFERQQVEFLLNKGGIQERYVLTLKANK